MNIFGPHNYEAMAPAEKGRLVRMREAVVREAAFNMRSVNVKVLLGRSLDTELEEMRTQYPSTDSENTDTGDVESSGAEIISITEASSYEAHQETLPETTPVSVNANGEVVDIRRYKAIKLAELELEAAYAAQAAAPPPEELE